MAIDGAEASGSTNKTKQAAMANKAILGAMALGIGGYTATEAIKDWQAEREKKNSEQALRDR
jgi:dsRNA-specific ribonuclease